jgi:hypothetical protein
MQRIKYTCYRGHTCRAHVKSCAQAHPGSRSGPGRAPQWGHPVVKNMSKSRFEKNPQYFKRWSDSEDDWEAEVPQGLVKTKSDKVRSEPREEKPRKLRRVARPLEE